MLLGDLGGVFGILTYITGFFLASISEQTFILKYVEKMFLAKTNTKNLLKEAWDKEFRTIKHG